MSSIIKDAETHALASELARRMETSMTKAIASALKEKLRATVDAGAEREERIRRARAISRECAARLSPEVKALGPGELLYDELGCRGDRR